jgi:chromate transport protein ChrA
MNAPPPTLDVSTLASFLTGTILPLLIAAVLSRYADSRFKAAFSFVACIVVALLVTVLTKSYAGTWGTSAADNAQLILINVVTLLFTSWQFFARLYQPMQITQAIERRGPQLGAPAAATPPAVPPAR